MKINNPKIRMVIVLGIIAVATLAAVWILSFQCAGQTPEEPDALRPEATTTLPGTAVWPDSTGVAGGAPGTVPQPSDGDPFYDAIWRGETDAVRNLIAAGVDVNAVDEDGNPYLLEAIWRGHVEIVQVLATAGADVNARDSDNDPLLREAIWRDHREVTHILINAGADVNAIDSDGDPLLFEAVWRGHYSRPFGAAILKQCNSWWTRART